MARLLSGSGEGWIQAAQPGDFGFFLGGPLSPWGRGCPAAGRHPALVEVRWWYWAPGTVRLLL